MKYKKGQKVVIISGILTGLAGWIIECDNPAMATIGMPYLVGLDESNEWMTEDYLMSLDELQQLRAENERLKAALETIYAEINQWSQIQAPPDVNTSVAMIARIESLVSEALEPNE